jgi:tetratricopeptide (TPR) repeat protein
VGLAYRAPWVAVELLKRVRDRIDANPRRERLDADLTVALSQLGDNEQVEQLARPLLAFSRDPVVAGRVAWTLGYALSRMAEAVGHEAGHLLAVGYTLHALVTLELSERRDIAAYAAAIDLALGVLGDEPEAADLRLLLMTNHAAALGSLGRPAEADDAFGRAMVFAERAGTPPRLANLRAQIADYSFYRGRWDEALTELQAAADLPTDTAYRLAGRGVGALIAVHRDDRQAAEQEFSDIEELTSPANALRLYADLVLVAWALTAEREGQPAQALARLLAAFDPAGTASFPS